MGVGYAIGELRNIGGHDDSWFGHLDLGVQ